MAILIEAPTEDQPEPDIQIRSADAELIRQIAMKIGRIEAVKVTRWLTKAGLKTSLDFVNSLSAEQDQ